MYGHSVFVSARVVMMACVGLLTSATLAAPRSPLAPPLDPLAAMHAATVLPGTHTAATKLPAGVRAAYVQARQKEAGAEYQVVARGTAVAATNAAHRLDLALDAQGVHLQPSDGAALSLRLVRAGCADQPTEISALAPRGQGTRVEYLHPNLTEWYQNGPLGLEQGFTLTRDPGCRRLGIELQLGAAWTAQLTGSGAEARIELVAETSGQRLYYSDLFAHDAQGKELGTRLLLSGQTIRLEVDAAGARYPVDIDPLMYTQQVLTIADGAAQDFTGLGAAVSGTTAMVGTPGRTINGNYQQGQVYVFARNSNVWSEQQKLVASDGAAGDAFGYTIAISGDTAIISSPGKSLDGNYQQGQAYVFTRSGTTWTETQKLDAPDPRSNSVFGIRFALSGDYAVFSDYQKQVGTNPSQGQAFVFARTGTTWALQQVLTAADGATNDLFSFALAISGDTIAIGAEQKTVGTNLSQGQAYVFTRSGTTWTQQQSLTASDGAAGAALGYAIAVSGNTLLVSAPASTVGANESQGQVYVFTRSGTTWTEEQLKLTASDGAAGDTFGIALAYSGDLAAASSYNKTVGMNPSQGQVYAFARQGTVWSEQQILTAADGAAGDAFGIFLATDGTTILGSSYIKTVGGNAIQGQTYAFFLPRSANGVKCAAAIDCQSGFCTDGVCCDTSCGSSSKTDCQSCVAAESGGTDGACAPIASRLRTTCRSAAGVCDSAELCDGVSTTCPADQRSAAGTVCRSAAAACDSAELCDGVSTSCPTDKLVAAGTVCQAAADASQRNAVCSGTSIACPAVQPAYEFSGGGVSGCAAALPMGATAAPRAAGAAWAITALLLVLAARRRARRAQV